MAVCALGVGWVVAAAVGGVVLGLILAKAAQSYFQFAAAAELERQATVENARLRAKVRIPEGYSWDCSFSFCRLDYASCSIHSPSALHWCIMQVEELQQLVTKYEPLAYRGKNTACTCASSLHVGRCRQWGGGSSILL